MSHLPPPGLSARSRFIDSSPNWTDHYGWNSRLPRTASCGRTPFSTCTCYPMQRRLQGSRSVGLARLDPNWGDCHAFGIGYSRLVGNKKARRSRTGEEAEGAVEARPVSAGYIAV